MAELPGMSPWSAMSGTYNWFNFLYSVWPLMLFHCDLLFKWVDTTQDRVGLGCPVPHTEHSRSLLGIDQVVMYIRICYVFLYFSFNLSLCAFPSTTSEPSLYLLSTPTLPHSLLPPSKPGTLKKITPYMTIICFCRWLQWMLTLCSPFPPPILLHLLNSLEVWQVVSICQDNSRSV